MNKFETKQKDFLNWFKELDWQTQDAVLSELMKIRGWEIDKEEPPFKVTWIADHDELSRKMTVTIEYKGKTYTVDYLVYFDEDGTYYDEELLNGDDLPEDLRELLKDYNFWELEEMLEEGE